MIDALQCARERILAPSGLDDRRLEQALDSVLGASVDAGDLYFQLAREEHWALEDGIVKEGTHGIEQGVGVRAMAGERTGFAYSDEIVPAALLEAARAARAIAREGGKGQVQAWHATAAHRLYPAEDPIATLADVDKVALLQELDRRARSLDPRVRQVVATLAAVHEIILVAASDGTLAADVRPLVRMNVSVIVEQNGRREQGYAGTGGRYSLQEFIAGEKPLRLAREAVRQATVNLESVPAPAGTMTVVLGPGWPGVLLHEAVGHGLEGDFNRKGTSAFTGRIGERVASELCTVVDDGTLPGRRGSLNIDDEGTPTSVHDADRERRAEGLPAGQAERAAHGRAADRQRPPRVLRAHDDAAHDEHLHAARAARPRRNHPLGQARPLCRQLRRRPGRHHLRQVRVLGQRGLPDRGRQGHRAGQGRDARSATARTC